MTHTPEEKAEAWAEARPQFDYCSAKYGYLAGHTQGWVEALEYCLDLFVNKHLNWEGMRNAIESKLQEVK